MLLEHKRNYALGMDALVTESNPQKLRVPWTEKPHPYTSVYLPHLAVVKIPGFRTDFRIVLVGGWGAVENEDF